MYRFIFFIIQILIVCSVYGQDSGFFDPSFNNGNAVSIYFPNGRPNELRDMKVQPDNKIVVCGWTRALYPENAFGVARLNEDGSVDSTFGVNGQVVFRVSTDDLAESLEILPDGKILIMGNVIYNNINGDIALARLNADGSIDSSYGMNGIYQFHIQEFSISGYLYDMKLDNSGRLLLAGYRTSGVYKELLLLRLNADNTLDQTFGDSGYAVVKYNSDAFASHVLLQSDGKIIVVGQYMPGSSYYFTAVRFNDNGSIDTTYGQGGIVTTKLRHSTTGDAYFKGNLQPDDKLVVAGERYDTGTEYNFMAMRFTTAGQVDSTFGANGRVDVDFYNLGLQDYGQQILIGHNGAVLIGGQAFNSNYFSRFGIVAVTSSGQIDTTFGTDGRGEMLGGYKMRAMEFDAAGRIVVAGQAVQTGHYWVGRFLYNNSPTAIGGYPDQQIANFQLAQNYPNPFNPVTSVRYELPAAAWVSLKIYDLLGREVKTLVNTSQAAGSYTVQWDGTDHAGQPVGSGVYVYRLQAGKVVLTRKMVLLR